MAITPDHKPSIAPVVGPDDPRRFTDSGIEIKNTYSDEDVGAGLEARLVAAGFEDVAISAGRDSFRFRARRSFA